MRSLRWRIGGWVVGTFTVLLAAFTAAGIHDDRRRMLALERVSAESLLQHLAAMPEFSGRGTATADRLAPIQSVLASTGAELELLRAGSPRASDAVYLAVQPLFLADGAFELRYRVGSDRRRGRKTEAPRGHRRHRADLVGASRRGERPLRQGIDTHRHARDDAGHPMMVPRRAVT